jgi:parvulin-like peptidyl-prolyl isomerase
MEEKLDFSLPEKKQKGPIANKAALALLLILAILASVSLVLILSDRERQIVSAPGTRGLSAEQTKELAAKLARRSLYLQAAQTWRDYLASSKLSDVEQAKALFQVATLLEKAERYAEAIEYFYRSEMTANLDELESDINAHVKNCFEKLGKFSALRYELMDRTSFAESDQAGGEVVAEIGAEKITEADLGAVIESNIDNQLAPLTAFMTPDDLREQKEKMVEQYKDSQARQQFLQSWLAQEILYREALATQLGARPEVKKLLDELSRGVLGQQLMNQQLASKINITETDLQTYYAANKDKYVESAKAKISHILVSEKQQAVDLIKRIKDGEDFAELAKEFSEDENTKANGGRIDSEVAAGSYVPVIGDANELNAAIMAAEPPTVLQEPSETEHGWEIVKVESRQPERQKGFDEVRQQVMVTLTNLKRQEVQQEFIKQMMDKYDVIIHTSTFAPSTEEASDTTGAGN